METPDNTRESCSLESILKVLEERKDYLSEKNIVNVARSLGLNQANAKEDAQDITAFSNLLRKWVGVERKLGGEATVKELVRALKENGMVEFADALRNRFLSQEENGLRHRRQYTDAQRDSWTGREPGLPITIRDLPEAEPIQRRRTLWGSIVDGIGSVFDVTPYGKAVGFYAKAKKCIFYLVCFVATVATAVDVISELIILEKRLSENNFNFSDLFLILRSGAMILLRIFFLSNWQDGICSNEIILEKHKKIFYTKETRNHGIISLLVAVVTVVFYTALPPFSIDDGPRQLVEVSAFLSSFVWGSSWLIYLFAAMRIVTLAVEHYAHDLVCVVALLINRGVKSLPELAVNEQAVGTESLQKISERSNKMISKTYLTVVASNLLLILSFIFLMRESRVRIVAFAETAVFLYKFGRIIWYGRLVEKAKDDNIQVGNVQSSSVLNVLRSIMRC